MVKVTLHCPSCGKQMGIDLEGKNYYCFDCLMKTLTPKEKEFVEQLSMSLAKWFSPLLKTKGFSIEAKTAAGSTSAKGGISGTETGRTSSKKRVTVGKKLCEIPSNNVGTCDLEWGHDGHQHSNAGDGFFAASYREEHTRRQEERKKGNTE